MNRKEFMNELEYLLQDIREEEKADALAYYRDYLEEAGDEHEAEVIEKFGSPERVAAIVRSDLAGVMEHGGEFTEAGYQDERFKDPNYQVIEHRHLPEVSEEPVKAEQTNSKRQKTNQPGSGDTIGMRCLKVGLFLLALMILSPLILGVGGGAIGIIAGMAGILLAGVLLIGVGTLAACVASVVVFVLGFGMMMSQAWWSGVLMIGAGILILGLALIGIALSILVYGTFFPFCIRGIVNLISSIFHRGGRKQA